MKNIVTFEPIASAPLAMINDAIALSRSPEKTTSDTPSRVGAPSLAGVPRGTAALRTRAVMTPFDEPTLQKLVAGARRPGADVAAEGGIGGGDFERFAYLHRRHGLEGLHDRPGTLEPDGVELMDVAGDGDLAACAFRFDLGGGPPFDALVVEEIGIGLLLGRPGVGLEAARQIADVLESGLLEDAIGEIAAQADLAEDYHRPAGVEFG